MATSAAAFGLLQSLANQEDREKPIHVSAEFAGRRGFGRRPGGVRRRRGRPLREGLWSSLITALYRSGRQADALAAYGRVREVLVEELHAQRLTVQALQSELLAFAHQLEVLEKSLAPLETWAHQWAGLRQTLTETLHSTAPEPDSETD